MVVRNETPFGSSSLWPWRETYWSVVASLTFLCTGLLRAYTSPALLSLQNDPEKMLSSPSIIHLPRHELISWIASAAPLASFIGTIFSGPCLEILGRQKTLCLLNASCLLGWLLIGNAHSVCVLLVGRGFTGLASGLATATTPLYISELMLPPEVRGCLGCLPGFMLCAGVLAGFVLAHQFEYWRNLALIIAIVPGLLLGLSLTLPESPCWTKGRDGGFDLEMEEVVPRKSHEKRKEKGKTENSSLIPKSSASQLSSLGVCIGLMFLQQFSGGTVIIYYLSEILTKNKGSNNDTFSSTNKSAAAIHKSSLIIGVVQFLGFFLSLPLIDKVGRRLLLITSALLMSIPYVVLGFHFHSVDQVSSPSSLSTSSIDELSTPSPTNYYVVAPNQSFSSELVLRVTCLCGVLSCYSVGLGPIPFLLTETLLPGSSRSKSSSCGGGYLASASSLANHFALFVAVKVFPFAFASGADLTFVGFAVVCWATALFARIVPGNEEDVQRTPSAT